MSNGRTHLALVGLSMLALGGCYRPAPDPEVKPSSATPSSASPSETGNVPLAQTSVAPAGSQVAPPPAAAASAALQVPPAPSSPAAEPAFEPPALEDEQGRVLPQTEDKPRADSPFLRAAAARLFEAIVKDDAKLALPFFFPLVAYEQVKDVKNPARDWQYRLVQSFERHVHEYHRALGKHRDRARFLRLEIPEARAEWMKPGREGNRLGYYRVLRSRLVYEDHEARERSFEVTSLISWRGEWYVVHLHGFE